jgi:flagellar biosynthesis protein FlhF
MKTKKIIADSMPHALKMVRQELGENAIIVNTAVVKTGGVFGLFAKQKYEVTAYSVDGEQAEPKFSLELKEKPEKNLSSKSTQKTVNEEQEKPSSGFHSKPQKLYNYYSQQSVDHVKTDFEKPQTLEGNVLSSERGNTDSSMDSNYRVERNIDSVASISRPNPPIDHNNQLLDEIQQMRKMMMNFMMVNEKQGGTLPTCLAKWVNHLKKQGVEEEVIEHLLDGLLKKYEDIHTLDDQSIKQEFCEIVEEIINKRVPESITVDAHTKMINMIGPTGVGKTTSIAKLATEQVLKQKRRVAMVTTDVYRIAAVEQLKTYAGILNVPFEVVRSAEELKRVLAKLEHYDLIYMDTTGRNYKEEKYRESINQYLDHPFKNDNYLVLSLTTKYEDMELLLDEFKESPINKLILTKFDETTSFGSILNIAYKYPYQLAYITNGQSVPEDIVAFDAKLIARYLLGEENSDGSSTNPSRIYASI